MALLAEGERCTFADVLTWRENERGEIINGNIFMMAPPSRRHQKILAELLRQLGNYLEGKPCEVYPAPFAVRLFEGKEDSPEDVDTMVEPDISVVCDKSKLDKYGCKGAPDMVIEILSPSTRRYDRFVKLNLYQRAGVREYWIVNPEEKTVQVFMPDAGGSLRLIEEYEGDSVNNMDNIDNMNNMARVSVLEGCLINLDRVFME